MQHLETMQEGVRGEEENLQKALQVTIACFLIVWWLLHSVGVCFRAMHPILAATLPCIQFDEDIYL